MEQWKVKALEQVNEIYSEVTKMGISIYKNFKGYENILWVEMGKRALEISCCGDFIRIYDWSDEGREYKNYKSTKWVIRYIKKQFERELSKINQ